MIESLSVLALIPARGRSKSFPDKNLAKLGGRSLVARAVDAARGSAYVDRVILSSDDAAIITEAVAAGAEAPFVRPPELATDEATTVSVVLHALSVVSPTPDYLVLLQPTSPLRTPDDVDRCIELCVRRGARACVSVVETDKSPFLLHWRGEDDQLKPVLSERPRSSRRQDMPAAYMLNGAVYVVRVRDFLAEPTFAPPGMLGIVMPAERSIDIDTPEDLAKAEQAGADEARRSYDDMAFNAVGRLTSGLVRLV